MSHIHIQRRHNLSYEKARESAEEIAFHLNRKFNLNYHWQGNHLYFERSGVNGYIAIEETIVRIQARLGFLLLPFKSRFEQEIHRYLDKVISEK
jgi:putative polyhydroxyalkanoate system protein